MKEIGGYIELDEARGAEYHNQAIALNSGRHCLEYLIKAKKITKLFIPYFLCSSIKKTCMKCNCEYEFYHINAEFKPLCEVNLAANEYIYIVNYYGQLTDQTIIEYKNRYKNIVVDNSQDFFRMPVKGIDTIYTCRKFFGVSDGGYLYTDTCIGEELPIDMSYERIHYILGRYEVDAGAFYKESADNNESFADESIKYMSKLTHNLLRNIDYEFVKKRRKENFKYLHNRLNEINRLDLTVPDGAFMYPFYVENGYMIRRELIQRKVFVPTLWEDVFDAIDESSLEYDFAKNIVPLPIDQRYDVLDMEYILGFIGNR